MFIEHYELTFWIFELCIVNTIILIGIILYLLLGDRD